MCVAACPPQLVAHVLDQLEYACALDLVTETGPAGVALLGEAGEAAQQRELDCAFRRAFGLDEPSPGGAWGSAWGAQQRRHGSSRGVLGGSRVR